MNSEKLNIIFLDMDGVINNHKVMKDWVKENGKSEDSIKRFREKYCLDGKGHYYIVPELMSKFNQMYSKIEHCKIVWSSSWRHSVGRDSKLFVSGLFYKAGLPKDSFLGYTPNISYRLRSDEILDWLDTFQYNYPIRKCAILDDSYDANPLLTTYQDIPIRFFQTTHELGLTDEIVERILVYFKED